MVVRVMVVLAMVVRVVVLSAVPETVLNHLRAGAVPPPCPGPSQRPDPSHWPTPGKMHFGITQTSIQIPVP